MNRFIVKKAVLSTCIALVIYYFIMELYYTYFIVENYLRFGFALNSNSYKYWETKLLFIAVLALLILVSRTGEFIYAIIVFFIVFFLVPGLITYSMSDQIPGPLYSTVFMLLAIGVISNFRLKVLELKSNSLSNGLIIFLIVLAIVPIIFSFGIHLNLKNFILQDITATRDYYDENSSSIINYLYNWLVKAILPILLVYFLIRKRYSFALVVLLILIYLYVISGNKLVYITSFVVIFFFLVGKDYYYKIKYFLYALIFGLLILPLIDQFIFHSHSLKAVFVMRMLFLPSQLNYYYFDFFENNPLYFSESNFFNAFFSYPYQKPVGFVISETYFKASDMNANNGIISDGYMNLGYLGVGLNVTLISIIFLIFNSFHIDSRYLGVFFVMIFLFLSAPMLSMFITSGLWIIFLMGWTFMKTKNTEVNIVA